MFTSYGINPKLYSITLTREQKNKIIEMLEDFIALDTDDIVIKKNLLPRLKDTADDANNFKMTVIEQGLILQVIADDLELYRYFSYNVK